MLAVIETGGKQYLVIPGSKINIEKLDKKKDQEVVFKNVLLVEKGNSLSLGTPLVKGAKVTAKVLEQKKGDKIIIFKRGKKYKRKKGHRQPFTKVEILKIDLA